MENFTEEEILEYFEDCFQNGDSTVKKIQNLRGRMAKWYFYNTYRDIFMVKIYLDSSNCPLFNIETNRTVRGQKVM